MQNRTKRESPLRSGFALLHEKAPGWNIAIPGLGLRLVCRLYYEAKISMVSPSAMVTMAFFQRRV